MTRDEILEVVSEEGFSPTDTCIEYAVQYYSYHNPLRYEEEFDDVEGTNEFQLSKELYDTLVIPYKTFDGFVQEFLNFRLSRDEGKIIFPYPYPFEDLKVEYYTVHEFTDENVTIPTRHARAFAYLICHFASIETLFGTRAIESVDDGVIKVKYSMAEKKRQQNTYLEKFNAMMKAKSPEFLVDRSTVDTTYDQILRW